METPSGPRIVLETSTIPIDALTPNAWNPNRQTAFQFQKEKESITTHGFIVPVIVRDLGEGRFEIIDGEHRWRAARELHFTSIPINNLGPMTDLQAKKLTIILNELKGKSDSIELSKLVADILSQTSYADVLHDLPFEPFDINSLLSLSKFDWSTVSGGPAPALATPPEGAWTTLTFNLAPGQAQIVEEALTRLIRELGLGGQHPREQALELIAADSLNTPLESYR